MTGPVERLVRALADEHGDIRDGLVDLPLPFAASMRPGLDTDALVEEALHQLDDDEAAILRTFAVRGDRADVAAMGRDDL